MKIYICEILEGLKVLFEMNSFTQLRISIGHEWFYDSFKSEGRNLIIKNAINGNKERHI